MRTELVKTERLNRALAVGRVPTRMIEVLQAMEDAGLAEHFVVVGTHALYAYEAAASVRIQSEALATQDVDLLWDARRRLQFAHDLARTESGSVLKILQRVDRSFRRKADQAMAAIDDRGFEVEFLRREPEGDDPHPYRFSDDPDDLWPVQARRAGVLTQAARIAVPVVGVTGRMTLMRTISPDVFVSFKRWLSSLDTSREPAKRRRDKRQADVVQALLDERLLLLPALPVRFAETGVEASDSDPLLPPEPLLRKRRRRTP